MEVVVSSFLSLIRASQAIRAAQGAQIMKQVQVDGVLSRMLESKYPTNNASPWAKGVDDLSYSKLMESRPPRWLRGPDDIAT